MTEYLIWSNEHEGWWRPGRHGYTRVIQWAGVYSEREALQILADCSMGEQVKAHDNIGLYADSTVPREVLVPVTDEGHPGGPSCPPHPLIRTMDGATYDPNTGEYVAGPDVAPPSVAVDGQLVPLHMDVPDLPEGTQLVVDATPLLGALPTDVEYDESGALRKPL